MFILIQEIRQLEIPHKLMETRVEGEVIHAFLILVYAAQTLAAEVPTPAAEIHFVQSALQAQLKQAQDAATAEYKQEFVTALDNGPLGLAQEKVALQEHQLLL